MLKAEVLQRQLGLWQGRGVRLVSQRRPDERDAKRQRGASHDIGSGRSHE